MVETGPSTPTHIVLVGGGHTHALVLRDWQRDAHPGIRLTLISPEPTAPYTGMLPGFVAGHYRREQLDIDLGKLCSRAGAGLLLDRVTDLDAVARTIQLAGGERMSFDLASINVGISSGDDVSTRFGPAAVSVKPLGPFASAWEQLLNRSLTTKCVVVIGAGLGGVELSLAMAHRLGDCGKVTLIEKGPEILPREAASLRRAMSVALDLAAVKVLTDANVTGADGEGLQLENGERLATELVAVAAGAYPSRWIAETDLATEGGFISVAPTLQSISHPHVLAAGDIAHLTGSPRPKAGVFAVRAAPVLAKNLIAIATGQPLSPFEPQGDYLRLVTLGSKKAVASKWGHTVRAPGLWRLKDGIDRAFMDSLD